MAGRIYGRSCHRNRGRLRQNPSHKGHLVQTPCVCLRLGSPGPIINHIHQQRLVSSANTPWRPIDRGDLAVVSGSRVQWANGLAHCDVGRADFPSASRPPTTVREGRMPRLLAQCANKEGIMIRGTVHSWLLAPLILLLGSTENQRVSELPTVDDQMSAPAAPGESVSQAPKSNVPAKASSQERERQVISLVFEAEAARHVDTRPVFRYNPKEDIERSLTQAGFNVVERGTQAPYVLDFKYSEVLFSPDGFVLRNEAGDTLLQEKILVGSVEHFVNQILPTMIKGRLESDDEVTLLVSLVKTRGPLGPPIGYRDLMAQNDHLIRLYHLNDRRATDVFVSSLRSCDPSQTVIAWYALVNLGYYPSTRSEEAVFDMVNLYDHGTVTMNFLREPDLPDQHRDRSKDLSLRSLITEYDSIGIELVVDGAKCKIMLPNAARFGGGSVTETEPERVLASLTEDAWPWRRDDFPPSYQQWDPKRSWNQEWNEAAVSILSKVLNDEHPELTPEREEEFKELAARVLSRIRGPDLPHLRIGLEGPLN
jgi:hypothetical protein